MSSEGRPTCMRTRAEYTAEEAADLLGITTEELFALVRTRLNEDEIDSRITFRRSDLVLLQVLSTGAR
jgi:hypothetical protein